MSHRANSRFFIRWFPLIAGTGFLVVLFLLGRRSHSDLVRKQDPARGRDASPICEKGTSPSSKRTLPNATARYDPAREIRFAIRVTDTAGNPIEGAAVALRLHIAGTCRPSTKAFATETDKGEALVELQEETDSTGTVTIASDQAKDACCALIRAHHKDFPVAAFRRLRLPNFSEPPCSVALPLPLEEAVINDGLMEVQLRLQKEGGLRLWFTGMSAASMPNETVECLLLDNSHRVETNESFVLASGRTDPYKIGGLVPGDKTLLLLPHSGLIAPMTCSARIVEGDTTDCYLPLTTARPGLSGYIKTRSGAPLQNVEVTVRQYIGSYDCSPYWHERPHWSGRTALMPGASLRETSIFLRDSRESPSCWASRSASTNADGWFEISGLLEADVRMFVLKDNRILLDERVPVAEHQTFYIREDVGWAYLSDPSILQFSGLSVSIRRAFEPNWISRPAPDEFGTAGVPLTPGRYCAIFRCADGEYSALSWFTVTAGISTGISPSFVRSGFIAGSEGKGLADDAKPIGGLWAVEQDAAVLLYLGAYPTPYPPGEYYVTPASKFDPRAAEKIRVEPGQTLTLKR